MILDGRELSDEEREEIADALNDAWAILRRVPGGHGHATDSCLYAARIIRPADSPDLRGDSATG